jgi:hypothetical protein
VKPEIVVSVRFRTPQENGRLTAISGNHYSCPFVVHDKAFDCRLVLDGRTLELGNRYEVPVKFMNPQLALPLLKVGTQFLLWEGKEVAAGEVVKISSK